MVRLVAWVLAGSVVGLGCGSGRSSDNDASGGRPAGGASGAASAQMGGDAGTTLGGRAGSSGAGGASAGRAQAGSESSGGSGAAAGASDSGAAGGSLAMGAGGGGGGKTVPLPCALPALGADLAHDWDVAVATVSGTVTLNGALMPDSPRVTSRGSVWFHDRNFGSNYVFPVGASGRADFSGLLFTGQYDVNFGTANDVNLVAMPVSKYVRVATAVTIGGDTVFQLDARTVAASGTLTANGGTVPSSSLIGSRGSIIFRDESTGSDYAFPINSTNTANFSAMVFASSYAIDFLTAADNRLVGLPVGKTARLAQGIVLDDDTSGLVYDLRPHAVSGGVTRNGAAMPDSPAVPSRGNVVFHTLPVGEDYAFPVSASGGAVYSGIVFEGTFDVDFATVNDFDLVGMPVNGAVRLDHDRAITGTRMHDYDLPVATVNGTVTVNGAAMPESPLTARRGTMIFNDMTTGTATVLSVTPTGAGSFSGLLFESSYEVLFHSGPDHNVVGLPIDRSVAVGKRELISGNASLEYDVRPIVVAGTLTTNGAALPDSPNLVSRGDVTLRDTLSGQKYSAPLSSTGAGSFSVELYASTYAVTFDTAHDETLVGLPSYATAHLARSELLTGSKSLAYDLTLVRASGIITRAGGELPSSPGVTTRGTAIFNERFTRSGGGFRLGPTGPGAFSVLLFAGAYNAAFATTSDTDLLGLPINVSKQLAVGCMPVRECERSADNLGGMWLIQMEGFGEIDADIAEAGGELSGNFHGETDGVFSSITRDRDSLTLYSESFGACKPFGLELTLVDPCTLVGTAFCTDESNPSNVRQVRAIR